ncbi:unnamed protein product [Timema podura]|uniref:UPF0547 domain-containing protein n=3 Tax=Timema TaxID=61471 RepID=A0A7R9I1R1_9NEOP|nr:unnamed protein product [Timema bartmani]CAD7600795.1 unnamed protein product [Timema genevievae]CAG2063434.1 unnamed protein product [Timema podura]
MIGKCCPECTQQVPVACKACPCGYSFFNAKRTVSTSDSAAETTAMDEGGAKRRRTERVKRGKPNFYDASQFDKDTKKRVRNRVDNTQRRANIDERSGQLKKKKGGVKKTEKDEEDKESVEECVSPENTMKSIVILAELNRKMVVTSWRA